MCFSITEQDKNTSCGFLPFGLRKYSGLQALYDSVARVLLTDAASKLLRVLRRPGKGYLPGQAQRCVCLMEKPAQIP